MECLDRRIQNSGFRLAPFILKNDTSNSNAIGSAFDRSLEVVAHTHRENVEVLATGTLLFGFVEEFLTSSERCSNKVHVLGVLSHRHQATDTDIDHRVDLVDQWDYCRWCNAVLLTLTGSIHLHEHLDRLITLGSDLLNLLGKTQ